MEEVSHLCPEWEIALLKHSIDVQSDGAYWFDSENRCVYVNDAGCRDIGLPRESILGHHVSHFNPRATPERLAWVWEQLRTHGSLRMETVHQRSDGADFPVELSLTYVQFGGREYNCGFARDITARKRMEAESARHQHAVAHLARLNVMGQVATGLAHELNQPLTAIRNYAHYCKSIIRDGTDLDLKLPEALDKVDQAAARASYIINRMKEFVRKEGIERKPTDVNDLVRKCLDLMEPSLNRARIRVDRALAMRLPLIPVDDVQIEQIVVNLVQNAIEAMAETPIAARSLMVGTHVNAEGDVCLAVGDRGCGIVPEVAARIFDEFFTTKKNGTGLGLSISRSIAESHGGRLVHRPNAGGGTIVELVLPLKREA